MTKQEAFLMVPGDKVTLLKTGGQFGINWLIGRELTITNYFDDRENMWSDIEVQCAGYHGWIPVANLELTTPTTEKLVIHHFNISLLGKDDDANKYLKELKKILNNSRVLIKILTSSSL